MARELDEDEGENEDARIELTNSETQELIERETQGIRSGLEAEISILDREVREIGSENIKFHPELLERINKVWDLAQNFDYGSDPDDGSEKYSRMLLDLKDLADDLIDDIDEDELKAEFGPDTSTAKSTYKSDNLSHDRRNSTNLKNSSAKTVAQKVHFKNPRIERAYMMGLKNENVTFHGEDGKQSEQ